VKNDLIIGSSGDGLFDIYKIENENLKRLWSSRDIILRYHVAGLGHLAGIFDLNIDKKIITTIEAQKK
jgi:hypothetical protein